jgi:hypothetical protein
MSLLTGIAFYLLFYIVVKKYKNKYWRSCKKETIALVMFGVPALLNGVVNPMTYHLWYGFIFVIPQALLLALLVTTIHHHILHHPYKMLYVLVVLILFVSATLSMNQHVRVVFAGINKNLFGKQIVNGTYKNTQLMLGVLSDELDLRSDEFYDRVYISGYHLLSKRRLKMLDTDLEGSGKKERNEKKLSCYYVWDETNSNFGYKDRQGRLINVFLKVKQQELDIELRPHSSSWHSIEDVMNLRIIAIEYQTTFCKYFENQMSDIQVVINWHQAVFAKY